MSKFLEDISQFRSDHESRESESQMLKYGVQSRYISALTRPGSTSTYHNIMSISMEREALIARRRG